MLCYFFSLQSSYKKNYIDAEGEAQAFYSSKVFGGWDFHIGSREAAALKHKALFKLFQVINPIFFIIEL